MAYDELVAQKFRNEISKIVTEPLEEKHMFGALGFMINGKLTVCVGDTDVMYKLGSEHAKQIIDQGLGEQVIMGKRTMKDWVNVSFGALEEPGVFEDCLTKSLDYSSKSKNYERTA